MSDLSNIYSVIWYRDLMSCIDKLEQQFASASIRLNRTYFFSFPPHWAKQEQETATSSSEIYSRKHMAFMEAFYFACILFIDTNLLSVVL